MNPRDPKVAVATVAIGGWYPRGVVRMMQAFESVSNGYEMSAWVNCFPPGAPGPVWERDVDYGGYCAKPFALKALMDSGAAIGIFLDASFWPVKNIWPLVKHIGNQGYYMAPDGFTVGQWISDAALDAFRLDREEVLTWSGCASGCVGVDFRKEAGRELVKRWAESWRTFAGHHSNDKAESNKYSYRNIGPVSDDPRVLGHRHDQSALAVIAHELGMTDYTNRPRFSAYESTGADWPEFTRANEETVLVCRGM